MPSGWLEGPQTVEVWVFPADAPVKEVAKGVKNAPTCSGVTQSCEENSGSWALTRDEVRERLSVTLGRIVISVLRSSPRPVPGDAESPGTLRQRRRSSRTLASQAPQPSCGWLSSTRR